MKFAVVVFPGSNSDHDAHYAVEHVLGEQAGSSGTRTPAWATPTS